MQIQIQKCKPCQLIKLSSQDTTSSTSPKVQTWPQFNRGQQRPENHWLSAVSTYFYFYLLFFYLSLRRSANLHHYISAEIARKICLYFNNYYKINIFWRNTLPFPQWKCVWSGCWWQLRKPLPLGWVCSVGERGVECPDQSKHPEGKIPTVIGRRCQRGTSMFWVHKTCHTNSRAHQEFMLFVNN